MQGQQEIIGLWVGSDAQKTAHHFYSLQAEQFYDDSEDPMNHHALWTFRDKHMNQKNPRMIIFDTESQHLTKLRKVNHKKILKKMSEPAKTESYFPFQFVPEGEKEEEVENDPNDYLYENWEGGEENYSLIGRQYNQLKTSFDLWEGFFQKGSETFEDKIRKHLERTDFLRLFTICSDAGKLGFTNKLVEYVRDQCPKRGIVCLTLSRESEDKYYGEGFLPMAGQLAGEVSVLVDCNMRKPTHSFFNGDNVYSSLAPVVNSLLTPFMLKNGRCDEYLQKIQQDNKNLFNLGYTLPLIDEQMSLGRNTNISEYLPKYSSKTGKKEIQLVGDESRVNFGNGTFLNFGEEWKTAKSLKDQLQKVDYQQQKLIVQSFVLKGNVKEVAEMFDKKGQNFQIKYLKGILGANPKAKLEYDQFYQKGYGKVVEDYPFHTVLFQHGAFGPAIRNYMRLNQTQRNENEMASEWKESVLSTADLYSQRLSDDSD